MSFAHVLSVPVCADWGSVGWTCARPIKHTACGSLPCLPWREPSAHTAGGLVPVWPRSPSLIGAESTRLRPPSARVTATEMPGPPSGSLKRRRRVHMTCESLAPSQSFNSPAHCALGQPNPIQKPPLPMEGSVNKSPSCQTPSALLLQHRPPVLPPCLSLPSVHVGRPWSFPTARLGCASWAGGRGEREGTPAASGLHGAARDGRAVLRVCVRPRVHM